MAGVSDIEWAARQVIRQHTEEPERMDDGAFPSRRTAVPVRATGRCAQCSPDGSCWMLTWARAELSALEAGRC